MKVRIRRYPQGCEEFSVELSQKTTLLDLLFRIKEEIDPSLTFRSMCRAGVCGTCGIKLDGRPVLACSTWIEPEREEILIEPLDRFVVVRDLVVDHEGMHSKLKGLVSSKKRSDYLSAKSWECILCGLCDSVCPVPSEGTAFAGPLTLTRFYKHLGSSEDLIRLKGFRPELCTHCMNCSYACPKRLMPEALIRQEESLLVESGLLDRPSGAFDFLSF